MSHFKRLRTILEQEMQFGIAAITLTWQFWFCIVPLFLIFFSSFFDVEHMTFAFGSLKNSISSVHFHIIGRSLLLSFIVSTACLIIGYPVAFWLARKVKTLKHFFMFLLVVPFWTNLLILAYSWIFIFEKAGLLNTILLNAGIINEPIALLNSFFAVVVVCVYCYLPFMILPLYTALEKIDTQVLEASADLGATSFQTFKNIVIPLSWRGLKTGLLLVFVPVYGEFAIPALVGGDKELLVGSTITHYIFTTLDIPTAAAFTLIACACLSVVFLFIFLIEPFFIKKEVS